MTFSEKVLLALCVAFLLFLAYLRSPKGRGWLGEMKVRLLLGKTKEGVRYVFNDYMLEQDGKTAQIDHILINSNGIFVIETKTYSGFIYGDDTRQEWTQITKKGKSKHKLYNPVKQNATHVFRIKNILPEGLVINSLIVFVNANIRHVKSNYVISLKDLTKTIRCHRTKLFSKDELIMIAEILTYNRCTNVSRRQHIRNIQQMRKDIANNICPRCGNRLIKKESRFGKFYACENYPKCTFIKKKMSN